MPEINCPVQIKDALKPLTGPQIADVPAGVSGKNRWPCPLPGPRQSGWPNATPNSAHNSRGPLPLSITIEGSPGLEPALPLSAAGVVLRRRSGESDEPTIKLRPCRRTELTPEWANRECDAG